MEKKIYTDGPYRKFVVEYHDEEKEGKVLKVVYIGTFSILDKQTGIDISSKRIEPLGLESTGKIIQTSYEDYPIVYAVGYKVPAGRDIVTEIQNLFS